MWWMSCGRCRNISGGWSLTIDSSVLELPTRMMPEPATQTSDCSTRCRGLACIQSPSYRGRWSSTPSVPSICAATIVFPVIIDGTTQPGFAGSPPHRTQWDERGTVCKWIENQLCGSTVKASRSIASVNKRNLLFLGDGSTIQGNYIGTNAAGTAAAGNATYGVLVNGSANNIIGARRSRRASHIGEWVAGIALSFQRGAATGNQVQGNYIRHKSAVRAL